MAPAPRLDAGSVRQTNFNNTQIISPFNGTVTAVNNPIGDTVGTATGHYSFRFIQRLLTVYIDETDLSKLAIGEEADAVFDAIPNQTFKGKVTQIVPALTTVDNVPAVQAQVQLDNTAGTALYVGLNATVNVINAQANNVLLVPIQALKLLEPGKYAVFVVQNGNLTLQPVVVGLMDQSYRRNQIRTCSRAMWSAPVWRRPIKVPVRRQYRTMKWSLKK